MKVSLKLVTDSFLSKLQITSYCDTPKRRSRCIHVLSRIISLFRREAVTRISREYILFARRRTYARSARGAPRSRGEKPAHEKIREGKEGETRVRSARGKRDSRLSRGGLLRICFRGEATRETPREEARFKVTMRVICGERARRGGPRDDKKSRDGDRDTV